MATKENVYQIEISFVFIENHIEIQKYKHRQKLTFVQIICVNSARGFD